MIPHPSDPKAISKLGYALGKWLYQSHWYRPIRIVLGSNGCKVDRELVAALAAGLSYYGADTYCIDTLTQKVIPAVLTEFQADGAVIFTAASGSTKPSSIQILTDTGTPLPYASEQAIQHLMAEQAEILQPPPIDRRRMHLSSPNT